MIDDEDSFLGGLCACVEADGDALLGVCQSINVSFTHKGTNNYLNSDIFLLNSDKIHNIIMVYSDMNTAFSRNLEIQKGTYPSGQIPFII